MNKIKEYKDLLDYEWKTKKCDAKNCWCALIAPKEKVFWDEDKIDEADEAWVVSSGSLPKELVKHFVILHNIWLKNKKYSNSKK